MSIGGRLRLHEGGAALRLSAPQRITCLNVS